MATGYIDPNGDIEKGWSGYPSSNHYQNIDDGVRQPEDPGLSDYIEAHAPITLTDSFEMTTFDLGGGTITSIKVWAFGDKSSDEDKVYASIYTGSWSSAKELNFIGPPTWQYAEWTGSWNQSVLDNLRVRVTYIPTDAIPSSIYALYVEITYTGGGPTPTPKSQVYIFG